MKRVRMLLRVSSNQQLEADGDLRVQRQLVKEYAEKQPGWQLDEKEYFEGSMSGYKHAVAERDVLKEALGDAKAGAYDILVAYKDDRIGRRMWEIGAYVMTLKNLGVDIYTVKDGCISPESDDIMGQMMLALRYGNAQKSSSDTGMRVKDTAQKLVQQGKFMGGCAPYGYRLELSGEISKHGRALHHLVIVPEQVEAVKYIFQLSLYQEYGSAKIARVLNEEERFQKLAPNGVWRSGTISSILTNPIYAGVTAYKRRERVNGKYHRNSQDDWVTAFSVNEALAIIDWELWNRAQEKRRLRGSRFTAGARSTDQTVIRRNDGTLPLIDVLYCGVCGAKMTNGSKYNYWTIKATGEKRCSKIAVYKCQNAWQGMVHDLPKQVRADCVEPLVYEAILPYLEPFFTREKVLQRQTEYRRQEQRVREQQMKKAQQELARLLQKIELMEQQIPEAMAGDYPLSLQELMALIRKYKQQARQQQELAARTKEEWACSTKSQQSLKQQSGELPTCREIFQQANSAEQRVLIDALVERIAFENTEIRIRFKIRRNHAKEPDLAQQEAAWAEAGAPE